VVALTSLHNMRCLKTFSGYETSPRHQYNGNSELSSRRRTLKVEIREYLGINCPIPTNSQNRREHLMYTCSYQCG